MIVVIIELQWYYNYVNGSDCNSGSYNGNYSCNCNYIHIDNYNDYNNIVILLYYNINNYNYNNYNYMVILLIL